jgi:RimJ/RimL family protein N-acetyltransferase
MTARVRLRALAPGDLALFRTLYCDARTMRHRGRPLARPRARSSVHATIAAARRRRGPRFFVIEERGRARAAGLCSIRPTDDPRRREVGIMLLRTRRGRGLASDALRVLIDRAFRRLPIAAISVQYRVANAAVSRLCDRLRFAAAAGRSGAKPMRCVRILRRSIWRGRGQPPARGKAMSKVIGFLEQAGRDVALRHATRERLLQQMNEDGIEAAHRQALLQGRGTELAALLGARETMYCSNQRIDAPMEAPAVTPTPTPTPAKKKAPKKKKPAKKAPVKKPPARKKSPAKKKGPARKKGPAKKKAPARKSPAKRKR